VTGGVFGFFVFFVLIIGKNRKIVIIIIVRVLIGLVDYG